MVEDEGAVGFGWIDINDDVQRAGPVEETSDNW
jgi:hypothetical protein